MSSFELSISSIEDLDLLPGLFAMLTIAAKEHRRASVFDVGSAYLNAEMEGEEVIMELDAVLSMILSRIAPGFATFVDGRGKVCVRLDRALYGCVQSAILLVQKSFVRLDGCGVCSQSTGTVCLEQVIWAASIDHPIIRR